MQAMQNFKDEWQNMRRMFVEDGFDPIFAKKDTSNPVSKVLYCALLCDPLCNSLRFVWGAR